ncbi:unnamed protein product [Mytilus edulis]|uniref:Uncharacterized protein n=1 Tax=Mytilus edulis TaxID=6550 RepID=A0A8S3VA67_MYTED|nr:unnamed protein product [Mytilus edulis]
MYTFVRNKKFTLLKCRNELEFEKVTKTARNDLPEVLENEFERTKGDFDTFIEKNTLKNIMLKWKQGYTMKLQSSLQSISEKSDKQIQLIKDEIKQISDCERAIKDCEGEINIYASELANEFKDVTKAEVSTDVLRDRFEKGWISWRTKCSTTQ